MEVLPLGDLMVPEDLETFLLMVLVVLVVLGDLVAFLILALEGLVALHLVVLVVLEVYHLLEAPEGLVVRLLVVLVVLVVLEALVVLGVLIPKINPLLANFPLVLRQNNLSFSPLMVLLVIICHINITSMCNPTNSYLS